MLCCHTGRPAPRRGTERHQFRLATPSSVQTFFDVRFGSKADICSAQAYVRYGPKADISALAKIASWDEISRPSQSQCYRGGPCQYAKLAGTITTRRSR